MSGGFEKVCLLSKRLLKNLKKKYNSVDLTQELINCSQRQLSGPYSMKVLLEFNFYELTSDLGSLRKEGRKERTREANY